MHAEAAVRALGALAHPTRLAIFRLLVQAGEQGLAAGEIARRTDTLANTLSANLATLAQAGLVGSRREGRSIIYTADYEQMRDLLGFLIEDCCQGRSQICGALGDLTACAVP